MNSTFNNKGPEWAPDRERTPDEWGALVKQLVMDGLVDWKAAAAVVLGQLKPPQVGTSLATNEKIKAQYPPRKAWQAVREQL